MENEMPTTSTITTKDGKALINDTELMARKILADNQPAWTPAVQSVTNVFVAMYANSLTVETIVALSNAMSMERDEADLRKALTAMVRSKALRRGVKGRYEINF
jgi:hypothetical protein